MLEAERVENNAIDPKIPGIAFEAFAQARLQSFVAAMVRQKREDDKKMLIREIERADAAVVTQVREALRKELNGI